MPDDVIGDILAQGPPEVVARELVREAKNRGGFDNVTVDRACASTQPGDAQSESEAPGAVAGRGRRPDRPGAHPCAGADAAPAGGAPRDADGADPVGDDAAVVLAGGRRRAGRRGPLAASSPVLLVALLVAARCWSPLSARSAADR